jgi:hypothetical protein
LPDAEAFAEHEAELFTLGGDDEIDIAAVMTRSFSAPGVDLAHDDVRLFLQATHDVWSSYWALGASTHALLALSELGVAPDEALFVSDRLQADVLGASRVGMKTVQPLWFRADDGASPVEPDYQAFTQMDVLNLVDRLRS